jgi:hypothetical protein
MAVLKKIRSRWWSQSETPASYQPLHEAPSVVAGDSKYDIRPLSISQLDECWRLDQRCFVDGEAYSRDTFEYLLTARSGCLSRVTTNGSIVGFVIGLIRA